MQESKRLMVILTPAPETDVADKSPTYSHTDAMTEFDWQVRLLKVVLSTDCQGSLPDSMSFTCFRWDSTTCWSREI